MRPAPDERAKARRLAMDLLARREHSRLELARKLSARGFEQAIVDEVLATLIEDQLLCEARFAEAFVNSRVRQGKGPVRIKLELKERGISGDAAREALDDAAVNWASLAADVLHRRFGESGPENFRESARRARFLGQRGFSADQIRRALAGSEYD